MADSCQKSDFVWQNPPQYCKVISLQLKLKNKRVLSSCLLPDGGSHCFLILRVLIQGFSSSWLTRHQRALLSLLKAFLGGQSPGWQTNPWDSNLFLSWLRLHLKGAVRQHPHSKLFLAETATPTPDALTGTQFSREMLPRYTGEPRLYPPCERGVIWWQCQAWKC